MPRLTAQPLARMPRDGSPLISSLLRTVRLAACASLAALPALALSGAVEMGQFNAIGLARSDDGSSSLTGLGFTVSFGGNSYSSLYVNNNGNVSFGYPRNVFTASQLQNHAPIVAPFLADVDTRGASGGTVSYGTGTFGGRPAFGANWLGVSCYNMTSPPQGANTFQLILVERSDTGTDNFDMVFNYDHIGWEAGQASNGNQDCLGGTAARSGYALAGTGGHQAHYELPGSATNGAFLNGGPQALSTHSLGSTTPGRYVFEVRGGIARPHGMWWINAQQPPAAQGAISCPATASAGTSATCSITVQPGQVLTGWGGDCAGAGTSTTCTLSNITRDQNVSAVLAAAPSAPHAIPSLGAAATALLSALAALLGWRRLRSPATAG